MKLFQVQALSSLFLAALLSVPAWASTASPNSAVPGTLNYVEGQTFLAGQPLDHNSIGKATLEVGQSLNTQTGKAEFLLTPGVFFREGDNSSVTMTADRLTDTEMQVNRGHAMVEVDQIYPQNDIRVVEGKATARILKPGLYDFDLRQNQMRVFDGQALVQDGDMQVKLKAGHELALDNNGPEKAEKFDKKAMSGDDLYRWSSLRSDYVAEANVDDARILLADDWYAAGFWGTGWDWGGWAWDPWFSAYTFMPWGGIFYSPFGWGFYSPALVYRAPFYGDHFYHTFNAANVQAWGPGPHYATSRAYAHGLYTGPGAARGAFHAGAVTAPSAGFGGMSAAGFRGGEAGVHGGGGFSGGGAGGFHGAGGLAGGR